MNPRLLFISAAVILLVVIVTFSLQPSNPKGEIGTVLTKENIGYICKYRTGNNKRRYNQCEGRLIKDLGQVMSPVLIKHAERGMQGEVMQKKKGKKKRNRKKNRDAQQQQQIAPTPAPETKTK